MIVLKDKFEFKERIKKDRVLVDFYADWCGPCKAIEPLLEEVDREGLIEVVKVDTDRFMSIARDNRIITIPNLKIFERGKVVKEKTGIMTKEELEKFIKV